jgi:hypothetical protein
VDSRSCKVRQIVELAGDAEDIRDAEVRHDEEDA